MKYIIINTKNVVLYHPKPSPMSPVYIRTTPLWETLVCVIQRSGTTGGFYEALMACDVEGSLFWQTPFDLLASICTQLAELAPGKRERAFLPSYQKARRYDRSGGN